MTLHRRLLLYLAVVHLVLTGFALMALKDHRLWLLVAEALLVISLALGVQLTRDVTRPRELLRDAARSLRERDFTARLRPVEQADLDELIALFNQMVDHLRAERVRGEEQQHFLERILAASPVGVVTLELDGRVLSANHGAARLLGTAEATLRGRPLAAIATPFARGLAAVPIGATEVLALEGARRVRAHHLGFPDRGFTRGFLLLEELSDELRRSEKAAYERLIRMMSHEVNNTSGAVSSLLESCLNYRDQLNAADRQDFVAALEVAGTRLAHMNQFMRHFADVVRLPPPRLEPTDPTALLDRIERIMRPSAERQGIRWERVDDPTIGPVALDPVQMEQALINIVKNAIEAVAEGGRGERVVGVRLEARAGTPWLIVRDSGPGLSPEAAGQVFTPFFTTRENGQGIGLTLVREILIGHGFPFSLEHSGGRTEFGIQFAPRPATAA